MFEEFPVAVLNGFKLALDAVCSSKTLCNFKVAITLLEQPPLLAFDPGDLAHAVVGAEVYVFNVLRGDGRSFAPAPVGHLLLLGHHWHLLHAVHSVHAWHAVHSVHAWHLVRLEMRLRVRVAEGGHGLGLLLLCVEVALLHQRHAHVGEVVLHKLQWVSVHFNHQSLKELHLPAFSFVFYQNLV